MLCEPRVCTWRRAHGHVEVGHQAVRRASQRPPSRWVLLGSYTRERVEAEMVINEIRRPSWRCSACQFIPEKQISENFPLDPVSAPAFGRQGDPPIHTHCVYA